MKKQKLKDLFHVEIPELHVSVEIKGLSAGSFTGNCNTP